MTVTLGGVQRDDGGERWIELVELGDAGPVLSAAAAREASGDLETTR